MRFHFAILLLLVFLLLTDDSEASFWRRVKKIGKKAVGVVKKVGKVAVRTAAKIARRVGKRSVNKTQQLCTFDIYDWNDNGVIEVSEMHNMMHLTGMTELEQYFGEMDTNNDKKVSIEEFEKKCSTISYKYPVH